jgi:hypothetical protein
MKSMLNSEKVAGVTCSAEKDAPDPLNKDKNKNLDQIRANSLSPPSPQIISPNTNSLNGNKDLTDERSGNDNLNPNEDKWLEGFLTRNAKQEETTNSPTEVVKAPNIYGVIYDEDASNEQSSEGAIDQPVSPEMHMTSPVQKEETFTTPENPESKPIMPSKSDFEDENNEVPVITYSGSEKSSQESP